MKVIVVTGGTYNVDPTHYHGEADFPVCNKAVEEDGKWGYVDKEGKEIVPLVYEDAEDYKDGKARVKTNGEYFYIDYNGNRID